MLSFVLSHVIFWRSAGREPHYDSGPMEKN
jgi:hypothetical protein